MATKFYKVLSIQSHVVSGYVGNKSATFPLQVLGFEVDPINSVQFSNHTGYRVFKGQVLNEDDLGNLLEGLTANKLDLSYTHLLTGYIGSASFLEKIAQVVKHLKKVCPSLLYICDPVMGDNGCMYVPKDLLPIYRDTIIPLADIITPNQYEAELLSGISIKRQSDMLLAIDWFHQLGIKTVAISSSDCGRPNHMLALASSLESGKKSQAAIDIPLLDGKFTGTGDLFAALFLAWMTLSSSNLSVALEKTISTLQAVLKRTLALSKHTGKGDGVLITELIELKLIQSKEDIEKAEVTLRSKPVS